MINNLVSKIILGFVTLIIGIALIGPIATGALNATEKELAINETLDISSARLNSGACPMGINNTYPLNVTNMPTGWELNGGCPISVFSMFDVFDVQATVTTDYVFHGDNGTLYLQNTTAFCWDNCSAAGTVAPNESLITYTYCNSDYLNIAWGRTILNLVAGFFALGLVGIGVGIFYSIGKDVGIV